MSNGPYFNTAAERRAYHGHKPKTAEKRFIRNFDDMVRKSIEEIEQVVAQRDKLLAKVKSKPSVTVSYTEAERITEIPRIIIGSLVSQRIVAGYKRDKVVSLSSLETWKALRSMKQMGKAA